MKNSLDLFHNVHFHYSYFFTLYQNHFSSIETHQQNIRISKDLKKLSLKVNQATLFGVLRKAMDRKTDIRVRVFFCCPNTMKKKKKDFLNIHRREPEPFMFRTITSLMYSLQFNSVTQLCPTLHNLMNHSTPGLPVHHQLPEFTQTHLL